MTPKWAFDQGRLFLRHLEDYRRYKKQFLEGLSGQYPPEEIAAIFLRAWESCTGLSLTSTLIGAQRKKGYEIRLKEVFNALAGGKPIQYILGRVSFLDLWFRVSPAALIPRRETEELVQWVLRSGLPGSGHFLRGLDVGTGSGCIAIALSRMGGIPFLGIDISRDAVELARKNCEELLGRENICAFSVFDFLDPGCWDELGVFDLLVSNPPYVPRQEKKALPPLVRDHEPALALFPPGDDPLAFYRAILGFSEKGVSPGAWIFVELHEDFYEAVESLFKKKGMEGVELKKDMQGKCRMLRARKPLE